MTHEALTAEVKRLHVEMYPNGCRPAPDWCVECAARLTGRTEVEVFAAVEAAEEPSDDVREAWEADNHARARMWGE